MYVWYVFPVFDYNTSDVPLSSQGILVLPGLLYDLVFSCMFRELRKRVARAVEEEGICPWLDVCCGTGDQFKRMARQSDKDEQRAGW